MTPDEFITTAKLRGLATAETAKQYAQGRNDLTEKQIELLKSLLLFSFHYLAADMNNSLFAYGDLPKRSQFCWYCSFSVLIVGEAKNELLPLVSWDDPEPLDIVQALKDNNVEV